MDVDAAEDQDTRAGYHDREDRKDPFTFESCPLKDPAGDIRVLGLLPGGSESPIECTLAAQSLAVATEHGHNQGYVALSYVPEHGEPSRSIKIHTAGGFAGMFNIMPNLYAAMSQLRHGNNVRYLWIDAICINQANTQEKNRQVPLMADVYRRAECLCVWLGERNNEGDVALDFIRGAGDLFATSVSAESEPDWRPFYAFISRPWFRHRWAIQAIALARRATLMCGDRNVSWHELANALSIVQEVIRKSSNDLTRNDDYDDWGHMSLQPAYRLAETRNYLRSVSGDEHQIGTLWSLETLLWKFQDFEASDPRDAIYALLALANDRSVISHFHSLTHIPIDYHRLYADVCKNYIVSTIHISGSLDVLCRPWEHYQEGIKIFPSGVPSWLPQTWSITFGRNISGKYDRINADVLVGFPKPGKRYYNACGSVTATNPFRFATGTKSSRIFIEGLVVDEIAKTHTCAWPGGERNFISDGVPKEWRAAGGWVPSAKEPPDAYWRTLVADRGPNGSATPDFYPVACQDQATQYVHIRKHYKRGPGMPITEARLELVNKFVKRVQEVVLNRRLVNTEWGRLGLAPPPVKKRDLVCILFGCSVPILLRRHIDADTSEDYFQIIGECYIHGMMEGEALELARRESGNNTLPTKQMFEIR